ncbi:MAG: GT2 family glycosyltransferase [Flavobacteriales bacterium]|jgi:GT2 family glycosyltransferase
MNDELMLVQKKIAVLLTCYNRKLKTLNCLTSFYNSNFPQDYIFDVFLVDDASTDGTADEIIKKYPNINIIQGNGHLFWAGGMRLAFESIKKSNVYDAYLLLNDDVELKSDFFSTILETKQYCLKNYNKGGIYSGSTIDKKSGLISYGGNLLYKGIDNPNYELVKPSNLPQPCHLTNANVLYVEKEVIDTIGFLDEKFVHGIADYDFSLRAFKAGFPVCITADICGYCEDDHGINLSNSKNLFKRIQYLKSPLGLSYNEYLFYIKRHYPKYYYLSVTKLWFRTLFPFVFRIIN